MRKRAPDPNTQTIEAPPLTLRAEVRADSIDVEGRTAEVVFSTGAPVLRYDWMTGGRYIETLGLEPKNVRLKRLNNDAPFLNGHSAWDVGDVLGVVVRGSAVVEKGRAVATVRFSRRADVEPVWQDVRDGILKHVSVGYRVHKYEQIEGDEKKLPIRHAIDWEPFEISAVPIGADDDAKIRSDESKVATNPCVIITRTEERTSMGDEARTVTPTTEQQNGSQPGNQPEPVRRSATDPGAPMATPEELQRQAAVQTEKDLGAEAENKRVLAIMQAVKHARLSPEFAHDLIKRKLPIEEAQRLVLEEVDRRGAGNQGPLPGPSGAQVVVDALDHIRAGIGNALLHRIDPKAWPLTENGRAYAHRPLLYHAETCLHARGVRTTGMDPLTLAGAAFGILGTELTLRVGLHTVSDFPLILADVANKVLRRAYEEAPQTFVPLTTRVDTSDFKTMNMVQLGDAPVLEEVGDNGEVKHGTIGEGREQFALRTYAKIVGLTRRAIVNDDLMAFARLVQMMGRAARNLESNLAWAQITSNPIMGDGIALFHASHGNLTTGPGTAISVDSLGVGRTALRKQKGIGANEYLNLVPRFIAVPPEKETLAQQYTIVTQGQQVLAPSAPGSVNPFAGALTVLAEPRLSDNSTTAWYLFADPSQIDILAWAVLAGQTGPRTETKIGFEVEGMQIKGAHDVAMKILDFRGAYKNDGA